MVEEAEGNLLIHAHQGQAVQQALLTFLGTLGVKAWEPIQPGTLRQELEWALETATTDLALDVALANLRHLPSVSGASTDLLASYPAGLSLFQPEPLLLFGAPNAGKSTLLNALAGRERSIVSMTAGTTRDLIEASIEVGGRRVLIKDAAGVRETPSGLESMGVSLAIQAAHHGKVLWIVNPHQTPGPRPRSAVALVLTHQDLGPGTPPTFEGPILRVGRGNEAHEVRTFLEGSHPPVPGGPILFTQRQKQVVEKALATGIWSQALWEGA
ncbi:MAG: GTPase [Planctomycetota bacterium]